jgi:hypothetical protein
MMKSKKIMSLSVADIISEDDKASIIRLWEVEGIKINTTACQNRTNHNLNHCGFSHEFLQHYPLVRCRYCVEGFCHDKNSCILRSIPDKFLGSITVYCVCRGFAEELQATNHHIHDDIVLGTEEDEVEPLFNPEPIFQIPAPVLSSNYNKTTIINADLLKTNNKIKRSNPNAYVHLTVDATTIDAILLLITKPTFEGILKLNARKFEDMVAELEPVQLLKFEETLSKIPAGEALLEIAKLKLQNEEHNATLRQQVAAVAHSNK